MPEGATSADLERIQVNLDTEKIRSWHSIVTLIVFVLTNLVVLCPFHIPVYLPRLLVDSFLRSLSALRIIAPRPNRTQDASKSERRTKDTSLVRFNFPLNFITAPLIAVLFLLVILAIGREEVHDGTVGVNHISPLDIMAFFLSLAYIALSIDASGLIRFLAFKVLQKGGSVGRRLYLYLYLFFFGLTAFIGNDPIILSGTPFLAYMTRMSSNITHPRAWIFTQFAVANIASAILVSSNPTNLVLAGAFSIKFIDYTANIIIPVIATVIILFPFLLYFIFADKELIPLSIKMHELPEEARGTEPINPNIPYARGREVGVDQENPYGESTNISSLEEVMNPFIDKFSAVFGTVVMSATLITLLALNAAGGGGKHPVFWITLPAAFIMFCWDIGVGWYNRKHTRGIARKGREDLERARAEQRAVCEEGLAAHVTEKPYISDSSVTSPHLTAPHGDIDSSEDRNLQDRIARQISLQDDRGPATLESTSSDAYEWTRETFPTATIVIAHLPFTLVPFAFCMFVLVQALVTKGWVPVFAHGWDHWVDRTGTVGAIGGMGFLSVVLSNFAGTNIGTAILLSRVIQAWQDIHMLNSVPISARTFWATVYSAALGLNYGAFSASFSASLAGLLWRDILARKNIHVGSLEFARVNVSIISISMVVGCVVLVGQVYVIRGKEAYDA
ncbi:hypothetical protein K504DRAFT_434450 [Pleomassaria siparia CBS 279.74]|uniref:Citrate transporter-like domain-containing protein n=1 Tax=Pleomassaria siparia CBS 279.74 TaxID=1314801 RepID=A0A6G1K758_9PLEO|nr:hypothetical protein K504DRAFT_434450 [Pleomassaria siparia CBS 279.74]